MQKPLDLEWKIEAVPSSNPPQTQTTFMIRNQWLLDPLWLKGLMCVYLHLHNDFGKMKPHCVEGPTRVYFLIH